MVTESVHAGMASLANGLPMKLASTGEDFSIGSLAGQPFDGTDTPSNDPATNRAFELAATEPRTAAEDQELLDCMNRMPEDDLAKLMHFLSPADMEAIYANATPTQLAAFGHRIATSPSLAPELKQTLVELGAASLSGPQLDVFASVVAADPGAMLALTNAVIAKGNEADIALLADHARDPESAAAILLALEHSPLLGQALESMDPKTIEQALFVIGGYTEANDSGSGFAQFTELGRLTSFLAAASNTSPEARANLIVGASSMIERVDPQTLNDPQTIDVLMTGITAAMDHDARAVVASLSMLDPHGHALSTYTEHMVANGRDLELISLWETFALEPPQSSDGQDDAYYAGYLLGSLTRGLEQAQHAHQVSQDRQRALLVGLVSLATNFIPGKPLITIPAGQGIEYLTDWLLESGQGNGPGGSLEAFVQEIIDTNFTAGVNEGDPLSHELERGFYDTYYPDTPLSDSRVKEWPLP